MPTVDPEHFKDVMRHWVAGVTVVTTRLDDVIRGVTANSFASVSLAPPLIAISLAKRLHTYQMMKQSRIFAVNILGEHQREVSERFAGKVLETEDRFQDEPHHVEATGAPVLDRALGFIDCRIVAEYDMGFNVIIIGRGEAGRVLNHQAPLIYTDRQYWRLTQEPPQSS